MTTDDANPVSRKRCLYAAIPVLLAGVLADQASKSWASLEAAEPRMLVPGYLAAYSVANAGSILGLGRDRAQTSTLFAVLGIACVTLLIGLAHSDRGRWRGADSLAVSVLLAGICGNTLDRLALGHVRDFLVAWVMPTVAFNVADLLVIAGAGALLIARYYDSTRPRTALTAG